MKEFIELVLQDNTKVTIAKRHIAFIEPLPDGKTRITSDIKTSITGSKTFVTNEPYLELIKRLEE